MDIKRSEIEHFLSQKQDATPPFIPPTKMPCLFARHLRFMQYEEALFFINLCAKTPLKSRWIAHGETYNHYLSEGYVLPSQATFISPAKQLGLITHIDLCPGDFVGEYVGRLCRNDSYLETKNYLYKYPLLDDIERHYVIDAEEIGNHTRFINHSNTPNLDTDYALHNGLLHAILIANSHIASGTELTYDYGPSYWYLRGQPE